MSDQSDSSSPLPLLIVLALPVLACLAILFFDEGIERSLFYAAIKVGSILVVIGGALSFIASRLAARSSS